MDIPYLGHYKVYNTNISNLEGKYFNRQPYLHPQWHICLRARSLTHGTVVWSRQGFVHYKQTARVRFSSVLYFYFLNPWIKR